MRHYSKLALFLASAVLPAHGAVKLAAHKIAKDITGAEVYSLASGGYNSTAGNLILIWAVSFSGSQPVGTITDSAGDTFQPAALHRGTWFGQWFYAKNVKGSDYNVITIRPATTGRATFTYPAMIVVELSGADKANPIAEVSGPEGALTEWTSKPFDAPPGGAALLGIVTANGGAFTAGDGSKIEDSYLTPNSSKFSTAVLDQYFAEAKPGAAASVKWTGTLQATGAVLVVKP